MASPSSPRASRTVALVTVVMLLSGAACTIVIKAKYSMWSFGVDGYREQFKRPWFEVLLMFTGMALLGVVDMPAQCSRRRLQLDCDSIPAETRQSRVGEGERPIGENLSFGRKALVMGIPAMCDLAASVLSNFGLLFIPASVYQMLRGSSIVFAALFSAAGLGQKMHYFEFLGLTICVAGVFLVGLANVLSVDSTSEVGTYMQTLLGTLLILVAQALQAAQVIMEEYFIKQVHLPPMQIMGFQGCWGVAAMCIAYSVMYFLPGNDHGHVTDVTDSLALLGHSPSLIGMSALYVVAACAFNGSSIFLTEVLSGVHQQILDAMRTAVVWAFGLYVHFAVDRSSELGENWTRYSRLEIAGFFALIFGQCLYGGTVRCSCPARWSAAKSVLEDPEVVEGPPIEPAANVVDLPPALSLV